MQGQACHRLGGTQMPAGAPAAAAGLWSRGPFRAPRPLLLRHRLGLQHGLLDFWPGRAQLLPGRLAKAAVVWSRGRLAPTLLLWGHRPGLLQGQASLCLRLPAAVSQQQLGLSPQGQPGWSQLKGTWEALCDVADPRSAHLPALALHHSLLGLIS